MAVGDNLSGNLIKVGFPLVAKLRGLFESKRFFAVLAAAIVKIAAGADSQIDPEIANAVVAALLAWVAGDTVRATGALREMLNSTRFWLTLVSLGTSVVAPWLGLPVAMVGPIVTAISVVVLGKSWREMEPKA